MSLFFLYKSPLSLLPIHPQKFNLLREALGWATKIRLASVGLFRFLFLQRRTFCDAVVSSLSDSCHGGSSDSDFCVLVEEITSLFKSRIMILFDNFCQGKQWFFLELAWESSTLRADL